MKLSGTGSVKMFRFSCFHAHINGHKPKKTIQASAEAMHKTSEDYSLIQLAKSNTNHTTLNALFSESHGEAQLGNDSKNISSFSSAERSWKSDEVKDKYILESDAGDHHSGLLKKSKSLGNVFFLENRNLDCDGTEDELDRGNSCDDLGGKRGFTFQVGIEDHQGISPPSLCHDLPSDSLRVSSGLVNYESNSSPQDLGNFDNVSHWNSGSPLSNENIRESGNHTARAAPVLVKALSLPSISSRSSVSGENSPLKYLAPYSKSSVDLHGFGTRKNDSSVNENDRLVLDQGGHDGTATAARNSHEIVADDADDSYNYVGSAKDWIVPVTHEISLDKSYRGDLSTSQWDKIPGEDFKTKRIQEWVMDLQHCGPLEEADELSFPDDDANKGFAILDGLNAIKLDSKTTPGMEAAKRYISSLNPTATTAQLANHGLVVIPFLSAFVSLKVLNLSGNAIVRITSGALPRGLHMLNLSKNNISTIEGLRELTRLRILDLSYNRIIRIGHGLASCSSLKELYLAGNKISEVEGLHRLLKLNVLDLRFNKISTAKCLGQLAANFNSLQAISLEGNPSQKNVGDEQLKKYLQGLLPHLAYYNRQPIKSSKLKDASDRSVRLGISERSLRSDPKLARKGGHGKGSHKPLSSSVHSRKNQAVVSPKLSKGRHPRLPPSVPKAATNQCHQHFDFGSKLLDMKVDLLMRKSRSEGTLGVA